MAGDPAIETTVVGRCVVVRVSGEMDYVTVPFFWERFLEALAGRDRFLVLDLSGVSFCDSAGLNVLLRAGRHARVSGVELVLACVPQHLRRILGMTGADRFFRVRETVAEAEADLGGRGNATLSPLECL
ncbi:STAS domain-containing protein [Streptomyces sp. ISL-10]|uniref:STAS domain-containing protein n=1 Tax=Streptomyces sp. ISL-10 TaxID=2819172 RepID=UPI001BEADC2C|nr:STAS domain-containing protein [Streptomyces sp. ISL-10]MBT2365734.1 STAS domain-containing protein [Streptomyces sp. ISL-10]